VPLPALPNPHLRHPSIQGDYRQQWDAAAKFNDLGATDKSQMRSGSTDRTRFQAQLRLLLSDKPVFSFPIRCTSLQLEQFGNFAFGNFAATLRLKRRSGGCIIPRTGEARMKIGSNVSGLPSEKWEWGVDDGFTKRIRSIRK
jgi:hypothetical protein